MVFEMVSGIDTNYCSDLNLHTFFGSTQSSDSCFRNHGADTTKCKTHFHGSFLGLQAPCQFVRHNPNFMATILSFFFDLVKAPTFFSTGVVSAKVFCQVVSVVTFTVISYVHLCSFLSCSIFMCFLYSGDSTNARDHDRSYGRQCCQRNRSTKIQTVAKKRTPYKKAA